MTLIREHQYEETGSDGAQIFDIDEPKTDALLASALLKSHGKAVIVVHGFNTLEQSRIADLHTGEEKQFERYETELGERISTANNQNVPVIALIEADPYYGGFSIEKTPEIVVPSQENFSRAYDRFVQKPGNVFSVVTRSEAPTPLTDNPKLNPYFSDPDQWPDSEGDFAAIEQNVRTAFVQKLQRLGLQEVVLCGTYLGDQQDLPEASPLV
jgi:hypothetical protein